MTEVEAIETTEQLLDWMDAHKKREPSLESADPDEKRLAEFLRDTRLARAAANSPQCVYCQKQTNMRMTWKGQTIPLCMDCQMPEVQEFFKQFPSLEHFVGVDEHGIPFTVER